MLKGLPIGVPVGEGYATCGHESCKVLEGLLGCG